VIHARKRPDPAPTVFGYHEPFHVLVILAMLQHAVVAFWVLEWTAGRCRGPESGAVRLPRMPVSRSRAVCADDPGLRRRGVSRSRQR